MTIGRGSGATTQRYSNLAWQSQRTESDEGEDDSVSKLVKSPIRIEGPDYAVRVGIEEGAVLLQNLGTVVSLGGSKAQQHLQFGAYIDGPNPPFEFHQASRRKKLSLLLRFLRAST
jgi:hypothetical protein